MIRLALWLAGLLLFSLPCAQVVEAQSAPKAAPKSKAKPKPAKSKRAAKAKTKSAPAATEKPEAAAPASEGKAPNVEDSSALAADADEHVRKEAGGEVKTMEFGGLDIEGNLKTPQMLYFLNRLRAEFGRPELPHRSFMPELQRGTKENAF